MEVEAEKSVNTVAVVLGSWYNLPTHRIRCAKNEFYFLQT
jgi:hypothetical protein